MTVLSCPLAGLRLFSRPPEREPSLGDDGDDNDAYTTHTCQPCTSGPIPGTPQEVETPAEDTFGSAQTHGETLAVNEFRRSGCGLWSLIRMIEGICCCAGMWEAKPEDQEQDEAVFKVSHLYCTVSEHFTATLSLAEWLRNERFLIKPHPIMQFGLCWWLCRRHSDWFCLLQLMDHFSNTELWNQTGEQRGWRKHTLWDQWHCTALYLVCVYEDGPRLFSLFTS